MAQGPSRGTQWDSNPQPLNTSVFRGVGSTTELSPTPKINPEKSIGQRNH